MEYSILDYLALAVLLIIWNVFFTGLQTPLGTNKPPADLPAASVGENGTGPVSPDEKLTSTLARIWALGGGGNREAFLDGARQVYEAVVTAFAAGDVATYADVLGPEVQQTFREVIAARQASGEVTSLTFIGLQAADVVDAGISDGYAWIEVRFAAEIVSTVRDRDGVLIAGHPEQVTKTSEIWTFECPLKSAAWGWRLVATDNAA